jgi:hypothetical protein
LGDILGDFFTNPSGYPGSEAKNLTLETINRRGKKDCNARNKISRAVPIGQKVFLCRQISDSFDFTTGRYIVQM